MKKIVLLFVVFFLFSSNWTILSQAATVNSTAQDITDAVNMSATTKINTGILLDSKYQTKLTTTAETNLTVTSENDIAAVYFVFEGEINNCLINAQEKYIKVGERKTTHELARLEKSVKKLTINIPKNTTICDIYFLSPGENLPPYIEDWQSASKKADIMLFPAHIGDEFTSMGGVLPYYAGELGLCVQVVYMINANASDKTKPNVHEMLNGLWAAGVKAYPIMSSAIQSDAKTLKEAEENYKEFGLEKYLVYMIRRYQPQVIIGHDINGENNVDCQYYTKTLLKAIELSNNSDYYQDISSEYGIWETKKTYLHLFNENIYTMDLNKTLNNFGGKKLSEVINNCFALYPTKPQKLNFSGKYDIRSFGLYSDKTKMKSSTNEFMENIVSYSQQAQQAGTPKLTKVTTQKNIEENKSGQSDDKLIYYLMIAGGIIICVVLIVLFFKSQIFDKRV